MSHVVSIKCEIKNLDCLEKACKTLGLEFVRDKKTYKWYGYSVGDYPIPAGFTAKDLGKCDHAIRVKGNANAYEVGVVQSRTKPGTYELLFDFFSNGYGLMQKIGDNAENLVQNYNVELAKEHLPFGWSTEVTKLANGDVVVEAVKY